MSSILRGLIGSRGMMMSMLRWLCTIIHLLCTEDTINSSEVLSNIIRIDAVEEQNILIQLDARHHTRRPHNGHPNSQVGT